MVRVWIILFLFVFVKIQAAVVVEASIDSDTAHENFPLYGTITITHAKDQLIQDSSFQIEGQSLVASLVKNVSMFSNANELVSIYSFEMPGKEKGLYILPPITVKVGNKEVQSTPSSYEIKGQMLSSKLTTSHTQDATVFKLEAKVEGATTLYPGERSKFQYLIFYNRSIDLTHSVFPMIHPEHFRKVGDVQIKEYEIGNISVQELTQEVEATAVGTFVLGPSRIEGYAYTIENEKKEYSSTRLTSESPAITIEVKPFPDTVRPPFFSGFLGNISAQAELKSSPTVSVGDHMSVQVLVKGIKNEQDIQFPLLHCQPGFDGFFQMGDLPPPSKRDDNGYLFTLDLRPLASLIQNVPSIQLSSFDTATQKYVVVKTDPIPITVLAYGVQRFALGDPTLFSLPQVKNWSHPEAVQIEKLSSIENSVEDTAFPKKFFGRGFIILSIMSVFLLLLLQWVGHHVWKSRSVVAVPKSKKLYRQALKNFGTSKSLHLLEEALRSLLREKNYISNDGNFYGRTKDDEKFAMARQFLYELQSLQYGSRKEYDRHRLKTDAQRVFGMFG